MGRRRGQGLGHGKRLSGGWSEWLGRTGRQWPTIERVIQLLGRELDSEMAEGHRQAANGAAHLAEALAAAADFLILPTAVALEVERRNQAGEVMKWLAALRRDRRRIVSP